MAGYGIGKFDFDYTMRYISSMTDFQFEDTHHFSPACTPQTDPATGVTDTVCPPFNSDVADHPNTGSVFYHDIRVKYTINKYQFFAGVDNIFNRLPPLGLTGTGAGSAVYDGIGRFFFAGATLTFK